MTSASFIRHRKWEIVVIINTTNTFSCVLVTIIAMHNTSNVVLFTADCNTIMLVCDLVPYFQDGGQ